MIEIHSFAELESTKQRESLAVLFDDVPSSQLDQRIAHAVQEIEQKILDPNNILTAWSSSQCVAVLVQELLPGNSVCLWPIRSRPCPNRIAMEDALLQRSIKQMRSAQIKVAQSILSPKTGSAAAALLRNGFRYVTHVSEMGRELAQPSPRPADWLTMRPQTTAIGEDFQRILEATFVETLDAPELNDLRTIDEVIAGHRVCAPNTKNWFLACRGDEPAGVLILAAESSPSHLEIAYFGVAPTYRKQGIGREIVAFSLQTARSMGARTLSVLVDERNRPAIDLYRSLGFQTVEMREVYLCVLQLI